MDAIDLKIEKDITEEPQVGAATTACAQRLESLTMAHGVKVIAWNEIAVFANFYALCTLDKMSCCFFSFLNEFWLRDTAADFMVIIMDFSSLVDY